MLRTPLAAASLCSQGYYEVIVVRQEVNRHIENIALSGIGVTWLWGAEQLRAVRVTKNGRIPAFWTQLKCADLFAIAVRQYLPEIR